MSDPTAQERSWQGADLADLLDHARRRLGPLLERARTARRESGARDIDAVLTSLLRRSSDPDLHALVADLNAGRVRRDEVLGSPAFCEAMRCWYDEVLGDRAQRTGGGPS